MTVAEPRPSGRRERKRRTTMVALRTAALELVCERGFSRVTVEDIAEQVDVSTRTFFNHFSSKEEAVVGMDRELVESMRRNLLALPGELTPLEALREVLLGRIQALQADVGLSGEDLATWVRRFAAVRSQPEVLLAYARQQAVTEQALVDTLVERLGGDEGLRGYATLVTSTALAAVRTAGTVWGGSGDIAALVQTATAAFDLLARGLPSVEPALREALRPPAQRREGRHGRPHGKMPWTTGVGSRSAS